MSLKPVLGVDRVFSPVFWRTGEVVPVFDDRGNLLVYALVPGSSFRDSLPTEFFHHQLPELDIHNPYEVARFMTEYGMLGNYHSSIDGFAENRGMTELDLIHSIGVFGSTYLPADIPNEITEKWAHEVFENMKPYVISAMRNALASKLPADEETIDRIVQNETILPLGIGNGCTVAVTPLSFQFEYSELMYASIAVDELVTNRGDALDRMRELHERIGFDTLSIDFNNCTIEEFIYDSLLSLNQYIRNLPQRIGFIKDDSEEPIFPGGFWGLGHLSTAIGLQISEFVHNVAHDGYFVCARCGQVFARKQSKSKRTRKPSDGTDAFCCDKCKSAEQSRRYRQSPGYKRKQSKAKDRQRNKEVDNG